MKRCKYINKKCGWHWLALYKKKNRLILADNTVIMDLTKRNLELKR